MIATIPFTENINDIIRYLHKYGHDLKRIVDRYNLRGFLFFKCDICQSQIGLNCINRNGFIFDYGSEWRIIINDSIVENANFYCEKYRALY